MDPALVVASRQLARMRAMNVAYHRRFFSDIRFSTLVILALFTAGMSLDPRLFLAIPVVALVGACQLSCTRRLGRVPTSPVWFCRSS